MTATLPPDVALRTVVASRSRCSCGDRLLPGETEWGICTPCLNAAEARTAGDVLRSMTPGRVRADLGCWAAGALLLAAVLVGVA